MLVETSGANHSVTVLVVHAQIFSQNLKAVFVVLGGKTLICLDHQVGHTVRAKHALKTVVTDELVGDGLFQVRHVCVVLANHKHSAIRLHTTPDASLVDVYALALHIFQDVYGDVLHGGEVLKLDAASLSFLLNVGHPLVGLLDVDTLTSTLTNTEVDDVINGVRLRASKCANAKVSHLV